MALTPSHMPPLGTLAPDFDLPDTEGKRVSLNSAGSARGFLVVFLCNHCPYVVHIRSVLAQVTAEYRHKGIAVFGINSNDVKSYPADSPEKMREEKKNAGYAFPYLFDETQAVAKAYGAACTPDFFLYDSGRRLVYRGQFDDSRPGNGKPVTGESLRTAMDQLAAGKPVTTEQKPSVGCNIKWK